LAKGQAKQNTALTKQEAVMKEADLFRQYSQEAVRSSSDATSENEKQALMVLACTWAQAALISEKETGQAFMPSLRRQTPKETTLSFNLSMNDTCPKCHRPLKPEVIEPSSTRPELSVRNFECADPVRAKLISLKPGRQSASAAT
jgi:hypothetical protein